MNEVEDEVHFVIKCPLYNGIREGLLSNAVQLDVNFVNMSDMSKLVFIMNKMQNHLARYVKQAWYKRKSHIYL